MKVALYEVVEHPDKSKGLGGSYEFDVSEAVSKVEAGTHKSESHPIGVVPPEWKTSLPVVDVEVKEKISAKGLK